MKLDHIAIVSIPVKDIQTSKRFYTEKLGFAVKREYPYGDTVWVEVAPENSQTSVVLTTWFPNMSPVEGLVVETPDVESVHTALKDHQVEVSDIETAPWGKYITVKDPDNNGWVIQQSAGGF
jgi:catechol 2,3-dioxygenase-like lactoylglutathione lyase family enzyme